MGQFLLVGIDMALLYATYVRRVGGKFNGLHVRVIKILPWLSSTSD